MLERHFVLFLSKTTALWIKFIIFSTVLAHEKCREFGNYVDIIRRSFCRRPPSCVGDCEFLSNFVETFCKIKAATLVRLLGSENEYHHGRPRNEGEEHGAKDQGAAVMDFLVRRLQSAGEVGTVH